MTVDGADSGTIVLEGPATIYEVSTLRDTLREALEQNRKLSIDLGDSGKWDLAGLQLLVSVANTARLNGCSLRLINVPRLCVEAADRSGLKDWLDSVSE